MENPDRPPAETVQAGRRWVNLLLGTGIIASIGSFLYPALRYILPPTVAESTSRSVVAASVNELKNNANIVDYRQFYYGG